MRKIVWLAAAAGVVLLGASQLASAQGIIIGPGGVRIDPGGRPGVEIRERIGRDAARRIARDEGMRDIFDVDREGDVYRVRGEDRRGRRMRVVIDAYNGRVLDVVRRD
jgi:hypothetical protein